MTYETEHTEPQNFGDRLALFLTMILRWFADTFFSSRYGHRAVVLETVAGVPGMVAGMLQHFKSLRRMRDDAGWIKTLLDEAENERMHLMIFIKIAQPNWFERFLIILAQGMFFWFYGFLYLVWPRVAHRMVGYFEEQAVISYTSYLEMIDSGVVENIPAPQVAIDYYDLGNNATLRDVVIRVREDEAGHRDVNHGFANKLGEKNANNHME